ncbi:nucleotide exchange factor GrpE [Bacteroidetes bacterium endosymbiont of Geopemphigus sp.]|uniref:nucleotide exchange factor GrpE n=1 Tax=Bacteroidetes bacterium endosymbiont of Geopemphigus sp. TaxID=2047937 RepID=UPI000CD10ABB|nr:nucleotide exchange factor GrpE [Bacteroidetes bacterium endosymbiont of Geopemphigus sp.]
MNTDRQDPQPIEESEEKKTSKKKVNNKVELSKEKSTQEEIYKKIEEEKDKFLRLFAEFENYKKRTQKERLDLFKTAHREVMVALIPVLDDFGRGMSEIKKSKDENLIRGIELIQEKFFRILKEQGLQEIKTQKGDDFNTDIHDAITQIPAPSKELQGKVVEIVESGYNLRDKVIRHAKVIVAK